MSAGRPSAAEGAAPASGAVTGAPSGSGAFALEVVAAPEGVDELGHVSNVAYVRWVQEAARAHSRAVGWDMDAYRRLGAAWVVRRHEVDYLVPARAGDRVRLVTWVDDWQAASSTRRTLVVRADDDRDLARAVTTWVLVSLDGGRPRRVPEELRRAFEQAPGG